jgi:long-chain acyl-CoA synthetase
MNIASHMERSGQTFADQPAIALAATPVFDYATMANRVACIAAALQNELLLAPGDRVALILNNCPEYIELLYACWHAGLVVVPVNAKLHRSDFDYILTNSGAKACFVSAKFFNTVNSLVDDTLQCVINVDIDSYSALLEYKPSPLTPRAPEDPAWLFYTSGTTGRPKGAVLSHRNLLAMCLCYFSDVDSAPPWQAILHAAPMSHGSGLYGLAHVMKGSCQIIPQSGKFDPAEVYHLIEHWPGLVFFAAPTMVKRLVEHPSTTDTSNLKAIIYGGGPMYVDDLLASMDKFGPKLTQLYGQGESPMTITALNAFQHANKNHPQWLEHLASVGTVQSAVQVKIVDEQGQWLAHGEIGEIIVQGETVMNGYWKNDQANAEALRDGWLYTGDYGVFDKQGFLTLKGRSKDVIISGGTNIYPLEVEEILLQHPLVSQVSVIGREDREWGEIVIAYLVATSGQTIDFEELEHFCIENMARFKRPKHYRTIERLPKNNYGKVLKTVLRDLENTVYE